MQTAAKVMLWDWLQVAIGGRALVEIKQRSPAKYPPQILQRT